MSKPARSSFGKRTPPMKKNAPHHPSVSNDCARERLAVSSVAAVDICGCGVMQVHIGAITLRMVPAAVRELAATLREAVARHGCEHDDLPSVAELLEAPGLGASRGDA